MNEVIRAAARLQTVCESEGWRFCFIGGLADQRWGEPRETVDVGLTLLTGFGGEDRFVSALLTHFEPRIDDAAAFAQANRVLLLRAPSGVGLDIATGGLPFEESAVGRSSLLPFPPDVALRTCSGEDLLVLKAFADRPKDWVDVDGIIIRQSGRIDWAYVRPQLSPLAELKEAPEIVAHLDRRRAELDRTDRLIPAISRIPKGIEPQLLQPRRRTGPVARVIIKSGGDNMIRTQISLEARDYALVKREARLLGISVAEFVRRAIRLGLPARGQAPWMRYAGLVESGNPRSSQTVDEIVYGAKD